MTLLRYVYIQHIINNNDKNASENNYLPKKLYYLKKVNNQIVQRIERKIDSKKYIYCVDKIVIAN